MSNFRKSAMAYMQSHDTWTTTDIVNHLAPAPSTRAVFSSRLGAYINELKHKGMIETTGVTKKPFTYRMVGNPVVPEKPVTPQNDQLTEMDMGRAIYDYLASLKRQIAELEKTIETMKAQARLRSASAAAIRKEKDDTINALKDEILELKRQPPQVVARVRSITRSEVTA